jgi:DoxX
MTFDVGENERKMSVYAGVFGLFNFAAVVAEMKGANLSSPRLCAATMIATQLVGSFLVITNVAGLTWLGAGILGVFTLLCIPYGHPFWRFEEPKRSEAVLGRTATSRASTRACAMSCSTARSSIPSEKLRSSSKAGSAITIRSGHMPHSATSHPHQRCS